MKHGLSLSTILSGPKTTDEYAALQNTIHDLSSQAFAHLAAARRLNENLPALTFNALYPAIGSSLYLERLSQNDFDPFFLSKSTSENYHTLQYNLTLLKSSFTKRF